jgi:hypothetical protein
MDEVNESVGVGVSVAVGGVVGTEVSVGLLRTGGVALFAAGTQAVSKIIKTGRKNLIPEACFIYCSFDIYIIQYIS